MQRGVVVLAVLFACRGAFGAALVGPSTAVLNGESFGVSVEYSQMDADIDFEGVGPAEDFDFRTGYVGFTAALTHRWDFYVRLGASQAEADGFDGDTDFSWGMGTRFTVFTWHDVSWGALAQLTNLNSQQDIVDEFLVDDELVLLEAEEELNLVEYVFATGPTWQRDRLALYGGLLVRYVTGELETDAGDFDVLGSVIPAARKRGIRTIPFLADQIHEDIPEFMEMAEWDLRGQRLPQVCLNNPHFGAYLEAMVEDCVRSYDIDGLLWRSERWGPMSNALSLSRGSGAVKSTETACFCPHCLQKGKAQGINVERVSEGYRALEAFAASARTGQSLPDGYYVTFWRLLLGYPEILAWDMFWYDGLREVFKAVYAKAKAIKPDLPVGWALPATISFNPFYRAAMNIRELAEYADFVKIIAYHTDGGPRCAKYVDALHATWLQDLPRDEVLAFEYKIMGYSQGSYDAIRTGGLSVEYVYHETKTWVDGARGTKLQIWPGIDIDVSPDETDPPRSREGVRDAVLAAFRAGAPGVVLSRMYSEMQLSHLAGAGDAVRALEKE